MSTPPRTNLLRRLIGMPAPAPRQDPADMGTAIGLDYCLDQSPLAEPMQARSETAPRGTRIWSARRRP
jgi:hypothetical protein